MKVNDLRPGDAVLLYGQPSQYVPNGELVLLFIVSVEVVETRRAPLGERPIMAKALHHRCISTALVNHQRQVKTPYFHEDGFGMAYRSPEGDDAELEAGWRGWDKVIIMRNADDAGG